MLSKWEFDVLSAVNEARTKPLPFEGPTFDAERGWFTVTQITDLNNLKGPSIRPVLYSLIGGGFVESKPLESGRYYRVTAKGKARLSQGFSEEQEQTFVNSSAWTGIIDPVQVAQVMVILGEMEDVCEQITENQPRAQIFGLIRALEILVNVPEPPRQGVVALLRDPAFANVVQVATFLTALVAAVKP